MHIAVLAATGATGRHLTRQALERGHRVTALARDPSRLGLPRSQKLQVISADVTRPETIAGALAGVDAVVSGLGQAEGAPPDLMRAGARALTTAATTTGGSPRVVWLGAFGTGTSAGVAGPLTRNLLKAVFGRELPDRVAADQIVLAAGGTVVHAGRFTDAALSPARRTVPLDEVSRRLMPPSISRATAAAAILDEAETGDHPGAVVVPLSR